MNARIPLSAIILVGGAALSLALPAIGQDRPESLLPPGFGDPVPPPPPVTARPQAPVNQAPNPQPSPAGASPTSIINPVDGGDILDETANVDVVKEINLTFDVAPSALRSLGNIGIISRSQGGYGENAFGRANGAYLAAVMDSFRRPIVSRWGSITMRRLLASQIITPDGIEGNDWAAARAALLLKMGEAVVARQLVQHVDASRYSKRLYEVAMDSFLANGDLAGMCPLSDNGARIVANAEWKMARPVCASLAGEQGRATALLNQAEAQRWMTGIDYRLAQKAVGVGTNGRRAVKIEWDGVTGFSAWRHGLSQATGIWPPQAVYGPAGRYLDGWLVQMPMLSITARMQAAPGAAAMGVLSNRAMVDLYAQALEDDEAGDDVRAKAEQLQTAYVAKTDGDRVDAMTLIWNGSADNRILQGNLVLTARAAALIMPSDEYLDQADRLIASMFSAGFDKNAVRWAHIVDEGSLGWGLLSVGAPAMSGRVSAAMLDKFHDQDDSEAYHKSAMLLAGLAGLGRVDNDVQRDFARRINADIMRNTKWTRAIAAAANRREIGPVMLLGSAGLQARDWSLVPPHHLYNIIKAYRQAGLVAEARMIAVEAVTFG